MRIPGVYHANANANPSSAYIRAMSRGKQAGPTHPPLSPPTGFLAGIVPTVPIGSVPTTAACAFRADWEMVRRPRAVPVRVAGASARKRGETCPGAIVGVVRFASKGDVDRSGELVGMPSLPWSSVFVNEDGRALSPAESGSDRDNSRRKPDLHLGWNFAARAQVG